MKEKAIVGIIYRPPSGDMPVFNEYIYSTMCKMNDEKKDCFILGDFNINTLYGKQSEFMNTILSCGFSPLIQNQPVFLQLLHR